MCNCETIAFHSFLFYEMNSKEPYSKCIIILKNLIANALYGMDHLIRLLLLFHILSGSLSLISSALSLNSEKGQSTHRFFNKEKRSRKIQNCKPPDKYASRHDSCNYPIFSYKFSNWTRVDIVGTSNYSYHSNNYLVECSNIKEIKSVLEYFYLCTTYAPKIKDNKNKYLNTWNSWLEVN